MPARSPASVKASESDALSFEQVLDKLEGVVTELERGELPLEQALAAFERGVMLSRKGASLLDDAERRIEVLLGQGEATEPLSLKEEDDE
jgi:exodeoxyribonuclease VII small subunit